MRLTDFLHPESFVTWAATYLDHNDPANVANILAAAEDKELQSISEVLADNAITSEQVLAVLVALDMYLHTLVPRVAPSGTLSFCCPPESVQA